MSKHNKVACKRVCHSLLVLETNCRIVYNIFFTISTNPLQKYVGFSVKLKYYCLSLTHLQFDLSNQMQIFTSVLWGVVIY